MKRQPGFILILVVGLLGVLSLLSLTLLRTGSVTTRLATANLLGTQARLGARSGLEVYLAESQRRSFDPAVPDSPGSADPTWYGEDLNADGFLDTGEDANGNGVLDTTLCPPELCLRPSHPRLVGGNVLQQTVDGQKRGLTGLLGATSFQLQVAPNEGLFLDLNGGMDAGRLTPTMTDATGAPRSYTADDVDHPFNQPTVSLLDVLGDWFKHKATVTDTYQYTLPPWDSANIPGETTLTPFTPDRSTPDGLGSRLISQRPASGWLNTAEHWEIIRTLVNQFAQDRLGSPPGTDFFREFRPFVSTSPTRNPRHLLHVAQPPIGFMTSLSPGNTGLPFNRLRSYPLPTAEIDIFRAPEELIFALISGPRNLQINIPAGAQIFEHPPWAIAWFQGTFLENGQYIGDVFAPPPGNPLLSTTDARRLAQDIVAARTGPDFQSMIDLQELLLSWDKGYDFRRDGWTDEPDQIEQDRLSGHRRLRLLWNLIRPLPWSDPVMGPGVEGAMMSSSPVWWDPQFKNGGGGTIDVTPLQYDPLNGHHVPGTRALLRGLAERVRVHAWFTGPDGRSLSNKVISVLARPARWLSLRTQRDFDLALGGRTKDDFCSLPELPPAPAAVWSGALALQPSYVDNVDTLHKMGSQIRGRWSFNPYAHPDDPTLNRVPGRPQWVNNSLFTMDGNYTPPFWTHSTTNCMDYLTLLRPAPGESSGSLTHSTDAEEHTHLAPGGGIDLKILETGHEIDQLSDRYQAHRLTLPGGPTLIDDIREGAISMLVRPGADSFAMEPWNNADPSADQPFPSDRLQGGCLFCWDFAVQDPALTTPFMAQLVVMWGRMGAPPSDDDRWHFPKLYPGVAGDLPFSDMQGSILDSNNFMYGSPYRTRQWRLWAELKLVPVLDGAGLPPGVTPFVVSTGLDAPGLPNSVSKTFCLDYPFGIHDTSGEDRDPFPHDRWHHVLVAWKNIEEMLNFANPATQGGCLAVWHNGTLKGQMGVFPYDGQFWSTHLDNNESFPDRLATCVPAADPRTSEDDFPLITGRESWFGTNLWPLRHPASTSHSMSGMSFIQISRADYQTLVSWNPMMNDSGLRQDWNRARLNKIHVGYMPTPTTGYSFGDPSKNDYGAMGTYAQDLQVLNVTIYESPGDAISPAGESGFLPEIDNYTYAPFPDPSGMPLTCELTPFAADPRVTGPAKILGVNWQAWLPEFHDLDHQNPGPPPAQGAYDNLMAILQDPEQLTSFYESSGTDFFGNFSNLADLVPEYPDGAWESRFMVEGSGEFYGDEWVIIHLPTGRVIQHVSDLPPDGLYEDGDMVLRPAPVFWYGGDPDTAFRYIYHDTDADIPLPENSVSSGSWDEGEDAMAANNLWIELVAPLPSGDVRLQRSQWALDPQATPGTVWVTPPEVVDPGTWTLQLNCGTGVDRRRLYASPTITGIDILWQGGGVPVFEDFVSD